MTGKDTLLSLCKVSDYAIVTARKITRAAVLIGLLSLPSFSQQANTSKTNNSYVQALQEYMAISEKLTQENHILTSENSDVWIAYDTTTGYGKLRIVSRKKSPNPLETMCIDNSKSKDEISFITFKEDGYSIAYLPERPAGKNCVILDKGEFMQAFMYWNSRDTLKLMQGDSAYFKYEARSGDIVLGNSIATNAEIKMGFFPMYERVRNKLIAAQYTYQAALPILKRLHYRIDKPFKGPSP